jgi:hypothetical protein
MRSSLESEYPKGDPDDTMRMRAPNWRGKLESSVRIQLGGNTTGRVAYLRLEGWHMCDCGGPQLITTRLQMADAPVVSSLVSHGQAVTVPDVPKFGPCHTQ